MTVWTKAEFRNDSHKYFSKRNGTIAEIDTGLDEFHGANDTVTKTQKLEDLYALIDKFEKEKGVKHLADPGKQSKKRKDSVAKLRIQVEAERWQWAYHGKAQERSDFRDYFLDLRSGDDDDEVLADWLERLKIQVKQGEANTNKLKRDLHESIEAYFSPDGARVWEPLYDLGPYPWSGGYVSRLSPGKYRPADNIRVASIDFNSIVGGAGFQYVRFGSDANLNWATAQEKSAMFSKTKAGMDALIGPKQSVNQVAERFPADLRKLMEDYLSSLLTADLLEQSNLVTRALASQQGYRAVVHLDYYATRDTTNVGLHKDTTGTNLFAVLHYINDSPMLGPEYIDDPAPIKTVVPGYYFDQYWSTLGDAYRRESAPWAKVKPGMCIWPSPLLEGLQIARESTKSDTARGKMAASILPVDGLVAFVDELIFHATPIENHRPDDDSEKAVRYCSAGVTLAAMKKDGAAYEAPFNLFGTKTHATRIQRRMSAHYDNGVHLETGLTLPGSKSGGVRKFFRLWITITPDNWYEPLPPFP